MWVQKAARTEPATLFSPDNTSVTSAAIKWKLKLISGWYSYFSSRFSSYAPRSSGEAGPGFSIKKSCFFIRCSLDTLFSVTMICCPGTKRWWFILNKFTATALSTYVSYYFCPKWRRMTWDILLWRCGLIYKVPPVTFALVAPFLYPSFSSELSNPLSFSLFVSHAL